MCIGRAQKLSYPRITTDWLTITPQAKNGMGRFAPKKFKQNKNLSKLFLQ
jgi:hypothetical protein